MSKILKFLFPTFDITNKNYWFCTIPVISCMGLLIGIILDIIVRL